MNVCSKKGPLILDLLCLVLVSATPFSALCGGLDPSSPPAPTMKTLQEVEPRVPIPGSDTATAPFVIDDPGSYYLTGNRIAGGNGIEINADNVTVDLMGFCLIGPDAGTNYGIYMNARSNVEIRNGTITEFGSHGIHDASTAAKEHRIINVRLISNKYAGIYFQSYSNGHLIKDCTAAANARNGIRTGYGSLVVGNIVYDTKLNDAIYACSGSTLIGNTVYKNNGRGLYGYEGCTMVHNTSSENDNFGIIANKGSNIVRNTSYKNGSSGIYAYSGSAVIGNTSCMNNTDNSNSHAGVYVLGECTVKDNTLSGNLHKNIWAANYDNAIVENLLTDSLYGVWFQFLGNFYANNRASGNTSANYGGNLPVGSGDGGGNVGF